LQATECNKCHSRVLWTQCSLTSLVFLFDDINHKTKQ
jgi:hypothetical protein